MIIIAFYSAKLFISNADSLLGSLLFHEVITMLRQHSTRVGSGQRQYSMSTYKIVIIKKQLKYFQHFVF